MKKIITAGALAAAAVSTTVALAGPAHAAEECVASDGSSSTPGAWGWASFTDWSPSSTTPADPDASGEDNLANLIQIGEGWGDTNDSAYRQKVSDGWQRFTAWQTSDLAPIVGANEEAGHRYEQTVGNGDGTEGTPGDWSNFEPNKSQGTFEGPPSYPTDPRGTWSAPKTEGGPQQDAEGVYQNGNGNGSWFHRAQGTQGTPETTHVQYRGTCTRPTSSTAGRCTSGPSSRALTRPCATRPRSPRKSPRKSRPQSPR